MHLGRRRGLVDKLSQRVMRILARVGQRCAPLLRLKHMRRHRFIRLDLRPRAGAGGAARIPGGARTRSVAACATAASAVC
jgi:hypothetical protein